MFDVLYQPYKLQYEYVYVVFDIETNLYFPYYRKALDWDSWGKIHLLFVFSLLHSADKYGAWITRGMTWVQTIITGECPWEL